MSNRHSGVIYTGVTNNLERRVQQHKQRLVKGFTCEYNLTRLVYYEVTKSIQAAIAREKQIKGWLRAKKVTLIEAINPTWLDLSNEVPAAQEPAKGPVVEGDSSLPPSPPRLRSGQARLRGTRRSE